MKDLLTNLANSDNVVVFLKMNDTYKLYLSDRQYWIMDYAKYSHLFDPSDNDYSFRFDIAILNGDNIKVFMDQMKAFEIHHNTLSKILSDFLPIDDWDSVSQIFPSIYLDFDGQKLYSVYSESMSFENYIPTGWVGLFGNFYDLIPTKYRYWIIDGHDVLNEFLDSR